MLLLLCWHRLPDTSACKRRCLTCEGRGGAPLGANNLRQPSSSGGDHSMYVLQQLSEGCVLSVCKKNCNERGDEMNYSCSMDEAGWSRTTKAAHEAECCCKVVHICVAVYSATSAHLLLVLL